MAVYVMLKCGSLVTLYSPAASAFPWCQDQLQSAPGPEQKPAQPHT